MGAKNQMIQKEQTFLWLIFLSLPFTDLFKPSDFHIFLHTKKWFGFQGFEESKEMNWLTFQVADFYVQVIKKLISQSENP